MKALTICQPYAELIASGEKIIENRTWPTSHRGPLLIHAGKSREWLDAGVEDTSWMAFGALVAACTLVDCLRVEKLPPHLQDNTHANGPWCWVLRDVKRLPAPVPMRGAQGLWDADFSIPEVRL